MLERWEWVLPVGTRITARLDHDHRVDSVWVDKKLYTVFPNGRPQRLHIALPPPPRELEAGAYRTASGPFEAELSLSPDGGCTLEHAGKIVSPQHRPRPPIHDPPGRSRTNSKTMRPLFTALYAAVVLPMCAALASGTHHPRPAYAPYAPPATTSTVPLSEHVVSTDGSIAVFHPADFSAITSESPSAVRIVRPELGEEMIFLSEAAARANGLADEHRRLFRIAMSLDPASGGQVASPSKIVPTTTCHGFPGVASSTTVQVRPNGRGPIRVRLDACTTILHDRAYLVATAVPEALEERDRPLFRKIDHVAELSTAAWHP
jgi:hypothetical protein